MRITIRYPVFCSIKRREAHYERLQWNDKILSRMGGVQVPKNFGSSRFSTSNMLFVIRVLFECTYSGARRKSTSHVCIYYFILHSGIGNVTVWYYFCNNFVTNAETFPMVKMNESVIIYERSRAIKYRLLNNV